MKIKRVLAALIALFCCLEPAVAGQTHVAVGRQFHRGRQGNRRRVQGQDGPRGGAELWLHAGSCIPRSPRARRSRCFSRPTSARRRRLSTRAWRPESLFTYAVGKLVLWSKDPALVKGEETLSAGGFAKLADCNPVARALWRGGGRNAQGASTLREARAEARPGREHRAGLPVRRNRQRRTRLRRAVAANQERQSARAGSSRRTFIRRSGRTPCC